MFDSEPLGKRKVPWKNLMVFCSRAHGSISRLNDSQPMITGVIIEATDIKTEATADTRTVAIRTAGIRTAATKMVDTVTAVIKTVEMVMIINQRIVEKEPLPTGAIAMNEMAQSNGTPSKRMKKCSVVITQKLA
jgi:hypothetical protein